jgi:hypothetical protein
MAIRQIESGTALSWNAAAAETVIVYRRRHRARWSKCGQREPHLDTAYRKYVVNLSRVMEAG